MIKIILLIWMLIGFAVIMYGIKVKNKYGYLTQYNIATLIIILVSIIAWPYALVSIINLIRRDEAIINEVIKDNTKYSRDDLLRGAEILNDLRKGKWPFQK